MTDSSDSAGDGGNVVILHDDELDQKVLRSRMAGTSIRRIARELSLTDRQVNASLDRTLPDLSPEMRIRLFKEDLARLDELLVAWFAQAKNGSATATGLVIKIMERRSALCGLDQPVAMRMEVIQAGATEQQNSTLVLLEHLNRIAAEHKQPDELVVEPETEAPA
jgi:hypothetical protein